MESLGICFVDRTQTLRKISRVTVPILVDTNPYSLEKRKHGEVSRSGHAAYASSIRTRILPESNFFRGMEYDEKYDVKQKKKNHETIILSLPFYPLITNDTLCK